MNSGSSILVLIEIKQNKTYNVLTLHITIKYINESGEDSALRTLWEKKKKKKMPVMLCGKGCMTVSEIVLFCKQVNL